MRRRPKYCQESAFDFFELALKAPKSSERLLCGALGIALHFLPNQSPVVSLEAIEELASTVKRRVHHPSPEALVAQLHEVLFDEMGFRGDPQHYFEIDNSLIPRVLETKRGLPITLTLVYKSVAERVGLTVEGINSPGHFLARVHVGNDRMLVDPFHGGRLLSDGEATQMVERIVGQSRQPGEEWFPVCNEHQWLHRILNNLRSLLIHSGSSRNVAAMRELQAVLSDEGGEQVPS